MRELSELFFLLFPLFLHLPRQSCWEAEQHVGCCWLPRGLGALDSGLWQIAFEQLNLNHPNFCNCYSSPPFQFSSLSSPLHQADYTFLQHAPPRKQTDGSSKSSFLDFVWVLVISLVSLFKKHCLNGLKQTF